MEIRPILSTLARHKTAAALIVLEIALTCAILCNALFLVVQRVEVLHMPTGIDEAHLLMAQVNGIGTQVDGDARTQEDLAALRAIPGVTDAVIVNQMPFRNGSWNSSLSLRRDQHTPTLNAAQYMVSEGTLKAIGLRLVAGRDFRADEFKSVDAITKAAGCRPCTRSCRRRSRPGTACARPTSAWSTPSCARPGWMAIAATRC